MRAFKFREYSEKLKTDVFALQLAYRRDDVPRAAKFAALAAIAYALSPIDLIPDFIPVLGYLDDMLVLPVLIFISVKLIPENVFEECRQKAIESAAGGASRKWRFAVPVIVLWALILAAAVKVMLG
jgi:uncharacterized membrane protein YkvA (DUF1232 family)